MQCTIAVVQCEIKQFEPEQNLRKMEHFIREAARQGAHMIVFPEDVVTGPLGNESHFADYDGRYIQHFQQLARLYQIDIVPGSIIEGTTQGLYNTTCYIDRQGEVLGRYSKINLWHPERPYISPGNTPVVFDTAYGRIGLCICWDLIFPELFRAMLEMGAELVLCPSYWCYEDAGAGIQFAPDSEVTLVNAVCVARAFEQEIILVYANAAGKTDGGIWEERLIGRSQVTAPFYGVLHRLDHDHEEMFLQQVDTSLLHTAESVYKIKADLRT